MKIVTKGLVLGMAVLALSACGKHKSKKAKAANALTPSAEVVNADDYGYKVQIKLPENNGTLSTTDAVVKADEIGEAQKSIVNPALSVFRVGPGLDTLVAQKLEGKTYSLFVFGRNGNDKKMNFIVKESVKSEAETQALIEKMVQFSLCEKTTVAKQFAGYAKQGKTFLNKPLVAGCSRSKAQIWSQKPGAGQVTPVAAPKQTESTMLPPDAHYQPEVRNAPIAPPIDRWADEASLPHAQPKADEPVSGSGWVQ